MKKLIMKIYRIVCTILLHINRDWAKTFDARFRYKCKLNLKNPTTLADKVSWLELHHDMPLKVKCTDKWEVRDYVRSKGLEEILVPVYGEARDKVEDLNLDDLPKSFAIKATHGCEMNFICADKATVDLNALKKEISGWLKTTFGKWSIEPHYFTIPHRYYVEKYLGDPNEIKDYKFHMYNGKPGFILVCGTRGTGLTLAVLDPDWNRIDCVIPKFVYKGDVPKPALYDKMLDIAKTLSADFHFVRVDLYEIDGHIYFGELTFSPASGCFPRYTQKFREEEGPKLDISDLLARWKK
ncbi:MAG: glycosyltransferase [Proteobacteria bacterium]|nr:glycosyltransferase [Pseudomonadota bacterium]